MPDEIPSSATDAPPSGVQRLIRGYQDGEAAREADELLVPLIQPEQYVGEVVALEYETALVQIHDAHRRQVGGVPSASFLLATRIQPGTELDPRAEDSSILLLRVMDAAPLPNHEEATRVRVQAAQQVAGPNEGHWDDASVMDHHTASLLGFAGVNCRVIGTFYLAPIASATATFQLRFGADLSNYYPNRGLKVYRPNGWALDTIVNYRDSGSAGVDIGHVRYASTNRAFQGIDGVPVRIVTEDLLGQKTALFGMTRTGKSNTTKIIARAVFDLRYDADVPRRVGQIIFDPNGEYANANAQDSGGEAPNALKNVWRADENGDPRDVVTYGISRHPHDPRRRLMLLNFHAEGNLELGKEVIDALLPTGETRYIQNFRRVTLAPPLPDADQGQLTRHRRRVLAYRALLVKAGLRPPSGMQPRTRNLFGQRLRNALNGTQDPELVQAAGVFSNPHPTWDQLHAAFTSLHGFIGSPSHRAFENDYMQNSESGEAWADVDLRAILEMIARPNGSQLVGRVRTQHTHEASTDYADDIYDALVAGRLVIVDQSSGDEVVNESSARRIVQRLFDGNKERFRQGASAAGIPEILIYAEEAHNLLPTDRSSDYRDVWVRTAKEGAKYNLGLIYVTQEVSSIQKNILKNTANWFIGHLNNRDETRELRKFYDFADFEGSILRAQDKGFLRVKMLSNPFVVPTQVSQFVLPLVLPESDESDAGVGE